MASKRQGSVALDRWGRWWGLVGLVRDVQVLEAEAEAALVV